MINKQYLMSCIREKYGTITKWAKEYNISERMAHYYLNKNMSAEMLVKLILDVNLEPSKIFIEKVIE